MPHSFGYRARTRDKLSKGFRKHGVPSLSRYLQPIKIGDYVDIIVDSAIQKGMPHNNYHGTTGVVFNVTRRACGVEVKKVVGNRQVAKRLHVRIEHIRKSRCQEEFLRRVKENDEAHKQAHAEKRRIKTKRQPVGPKPAELVKGEVLLLEPAMFVEKFD